jgi:hypothetical protein
MGFRAFKTAARWCFCKLLDCSQAYGSLFHAIDASAIMIKPAQRLSPPVLRAFKPAGVLQAPESYGRVFQVIDASAIKPAGVLQAPGAYGSVFHAIDASAIMIKPAQLLSPPVLRAIEPAGAP